jgi:hypothetical protein
MQGDGGMVQIQLNQQDAEILEDVLESYLSDLSVEIANTDLQAFREGLKTKKDVLNKVLGELKESATH